MIYQGEYMINLIIIALIIVVAALIAYFIFKKDPYQEDDEEDDDFSCEALAEGVKKIVNEIINTNVAELGLNQVETKKREKLKVEISKAWRSCYLGDPGQKEYVKDYIKYILQKYLKINENTIDKPIKFLDEESLTGQDMGDILLYYYKSKLHYGGEAFEKMCEENNIVIEKEYEDGIYYEISDEDIAEVYKTVTPVLTYVDKLEIVAQRVYQLARGLGPVDELRDQSCLDGVSGGVSGINDEDYNYLEEVIQEREEKHLFRHDSVWISLKGKAIHLKYLSFGSKRELERVCKNIYGYDAPYYLSGIRGKIVAEDKRGNRISVARPPFADSWKFVVRKFDSVKNLIAIENLYKDEGAELVIGTMKYIIMGYMAVVITGNTGTGKTTLLKALIRFMDPTNTISMEEEVFEAWINKIFPSRKINMFRKTDYISMEEGLDFTKKMDTDIAILGEVAEQAAAALLIMITQFTKLTLCTNHMATTQKMIEYFRNAGLSQRIFSSEVEAEEQVVSALNWDFHMKRVRGHRFIERITEIIPVEDDEIPDGTSVKEALLIYLRQKTRRRRYTTRDIVVFENGRYVAKNIPSISSLNKIRENLDEKDLKEFNAFYDKYFSHLEDELQRHDGRKDVECA